MAALTKSLNKRNNTDMVISLYLNHSEDFYSTMALTKDYMMADEVLDSLERKEGMPSLNQHKDVKGTDTPTNAPKIQGHCQLPQGAIFC